MPFEFEFVPEFEFFTSPLHFASGAEVSSEILSLSEALYWPPITRVVLLK